MDLQQQLYRARNLLKFKEFLEVLCCLAVKLILPH
nr:MAG TPA: hypothetical protein [Bacteriophage sp.]